MFILDIHTIEVFLLRNKNTLINTTFSVTNKDTILIAVLLARFRIGKTKKRTPLWI